MNSFSVGDSVTITDSRALKTFGYKSGHSFKVKSVGPVLVKLDCGLEVNPKYLASLTPNNVRKFLDIDELTALVDGRIYDLADSETLFTVHDITRQLREENSDLEISHSDVQRIVGDAYENYGLVRTTVKVGASGAEPFVYHAEGQDPTEYSKDEVSFTVYFL